LTLVQRDNRTLQVFDRVRVKVYVARTVGNRQELKMDLLDADDEDEGDVKVDKQQQEAEATLRAVRKKRKVAA
ncbi:hypothetical protein BBJ28_00016068, partial [Nothophytophthora sp. Chile5]